MYVAAAENTTDQKNHCTTERTVISGHLGAGRHHRLVPLARLQRPERVVG
jgi:hypothetical protein